VPQGRSYLTQVPGLLGADGLNAVCDASESEGARLMPYARNGLMRLYYESTGTGTPVLLINGQGMTLDSAWRTIDVLARSFRVLAFDNRDTGRSSYTPVPYSVLQMADDAIAVLDAAGERSAHVYGISLGGIVALDLALRHPDRVRALVLGATTPGGPTAIPHDPQTLTFFARVGAMAPEEAEWAAVPYTYGVTTRRLHAQRIAEDIARRLDSRPENIPLATLAYIHQVAVAATHNRMLNIARITAPTLVVHGAEDGTMSPENAHIMAKAIPGAELQMWPGAGHAYVTDEPRADEEIAKFLLRH
jgi:pimeloyl-ACP methyl ester carboxylesterase